MGLLGGAHTGDEGKVWITNTHYPMSYQDCHQFTANKFIYLMRNPFDLILQMAHVHNTMSHFLQPNETYIESFPRYWDDLIRKLAQKIRQQHDFVVNVLSK